MGQISLGGTKFVFDFTVHWHTLHKSSLNILYECSFGMITEHINVFQLDFC